jgi:hypothetical protein
VLGGGMAGHSTAVDPTQRPTMPNPDPSNHMAAMWLDHLNKMFASQRSAAAKGNLQDDSLYGRPFPGSSQHIKINNIGWPAVGLAAIGVTAAAAVGLWALNGKQMPSLPKSEPVVVAPQEPPAGEPDQPQGIEWIITITQEPDGTANAEIEQAN